MKRERDPTAEEFEKLLRWLDCDRDGAGHRFEQIQMRLTKIFASRGCIDAETLADEVSNRVAARIDSVVEKYDDPLRCCLGFVENVYLEYLREEHKRSHVKEPPKPRPAEELEREDQCLERCLRNMNVPERDLFVRYFGGERRSRINGRRKLAEELTLTANALRIQAHRIRKKVRRCLEECLSEFQLRNS
jgi:DNA-directed RNA polymerase specialized sigma24 family protein